LGVASLAAQQTSGKVEGTVSDQAGAPVANAQVFVVGTSFGATTSDKGYYFINNVPIGTYTLRAQFIAAPSEVRNCVCPAVRRSPQTSRCSHRRSC
jgi:iron complex outermembrane receptor protein